MEQLLVSLLISLALLATVQAQDDVRQVSAKQLGRRSNGLPHCLGEAIALNPRREKKSDEEANPRGDRKKLVVIDEDADMDDEAMVAVMTKDAAKAEAKAAAEADRRAEIAAKREEMEQKAKILQDKIKARADAAVEAFKTQCEGVTDSPKKEICDRIAAHNGGDKKRQERQRVTVTNKDGGSNSNNADTQKDEETRSVICDFVFKQPDSSQHLKDICTNQMADAETEEKEEREVAIKLRNAKAAEAEAEAKQKIAERLAAAIKKEADVKERESKNVKVKAAVAAKDACDTDECEKAARAKIALAKIAACKELDCTHKVKCFRRRAKRVRLNIRRAIACDATEEEAQEAVDALITRAFEARCEGLPLAPAEEADNDNGDNNNKKRQDAAPDAEATETEATETPAEKEAKEKRAAKFCSYKHYELLQGFAARIVEKKFSEGSEEPADNNDKRQDKAGDVERRLTCRKDVVAHVDFPVEEAADLAVEQDDRKRQALEDDLSAFFAETVLESDMDASDVTVTNEASSDPLVVEVFTDEDAAETEATTDPVTDPNQEDVKMEDNSASSVVATLALGVALLAVFF